LGFLSIGLDVASEGDNALLTILTDADIAQPHLVEGPPNAGSDIWRLGVSIGASAKTADDGESDDRCCQFKNSHDSPLLVSATYKNLEQLGNPGR
jgi:hypothetical protein